jgi:hypothetical protein
MLIMETLLEAARTRLVATGFAGGMLEKHRDPPTVDAGLPLATITYENDSGDADGDPRTGTSDFVHKLTLVVDVLASGANGAAVMASLAQYGEHAMAALCVDPWNWSANVVEGIGGVRQLTEKSPVGERIVYRRQIQIDVLYRSQWDTATDGLPYLDTVGIDTGFGAVPPEDEDDPGTPGIGITIPVPTT